MATGWLKKTHAVSLWEYVVIGAVALVLANAIVVLVLLLLNRRHAPHYWED